MASLGLAHKCLQLSLYHWGISKGWGVLWLQLHLGNTGTEVELRKSTHETPGESRKKSQALLCYFLEAELPYDKMAGFCPFRAIPIENLMKGVDCCYRKWALFFTFNVKSFWTLEAGPEFPRGELLVLSAGWVQPCKSPWFFFHSLWPTGRHLQIPVVWASCGCP